VPLPDGAVTSSPDGRTVSVDVHDLAVIDDPGAVPATVSFQITWKGRHGRRRLGRGTKVPPTAAAAFLGRFFRVARATGSFSGSEAGFTFSSDPKPVPKSRFAELGTERNGSFLAAAARCRACGAPATPAGGGW
jgi:hypothetical protein